MKKAHGEQELAVFSLKHALLTEKGVRPAELLDLPPAFLVLSWCLPPSADCVGVYWSQLRPKCLNYLETPKIKLLPGAAAGLHLHPVLG